MMAKKRDLATTFGNVANNNDTKDSFKESINTDTNTSTNINTDTDINKATDNNLDFNDNQESNNDINSITSIVNKVASNKKDQPRKKQISIYINEDIAKEFDKFGKKHGKGARSDLIEALLKEALK